MDKLKSITLIFENCDSVKIHEKYIDHFMATNNEKTYILVNMNEVYSYECSNFFFLRLKGIDGLKYNDNVDNMFVDMVKKYHDITGFIVEYGDKKVFLSVPWDHKHHFENAYMDTFKKDKWGRWTIRIEKKWKVSNMIRVWFSIVKSYIYRTRKDKITRFIRKSH